MFWTRRLLLVSHRSVLFFASTALITALVALSPAIGAAAEQVQGGQVPGSAAGGGAQAAAAAPQARAITVDEALKLALENSTDLRTASLDLKSAELALVEAQASDLLRPSPVTLLQAETNLAVARRNLDLAREQLVISTLEAYYNVVRTENLVAVAEDARKRAKDQEAQVQARFRAGVVAQIDLLKASSNVLSKVAAEDKARGNRDLAVLKFLQLLNVPLETEVSLASSVKQEDAKADLPGDIKQALVSRLEIAQAEATIRMREQEVLLNDNDYTPVLTLEKSKVALEKARLALVTVRNRIELEIRQNYLALLDAASRIESSQRAVAEAQETLRITELRYKADIATVSEVADAQAAFTSARTDYVHALFDYNLARIKYLYGVGRPVTPDLSR